MNNFNCVRETLNWGNIENSDKFDNSKFSPKKFIEKMWTNSPKMATMMTNIKNLDAKDDKETGKLYKHFIYTDLKKQRSVKLLVSAFIAAGYNFCIKKDKGSKLLLDYQQDNESNFTVLSSVSIYGTPVSPKMIKQILTDFNERPGNIYGEKCRFIILDSGFKEGVDLFDVKYCHIFEDQETEADLIQAIGRGTRSCGQKGLPLDKTRGWVLETFVYTSTFLDETTVKKQKKNWYENLWGNKTSDKADTEIDVIQYYNNKDLKRSKNYNTVSDIEKLLVENAIDYELTKKFHYSSKNDNTSFEIKAKKGPKGSVVKAVEQGRGLLKRIAKGVVIVAGIAGLTFAGVLAYKKLKKNKKSSIVIPEPRRLTFR